MSTPATHAHDLVAERLPPEDPATWEYSEFPQLGGWTTSIGVMNTGKRPQIVFGDSGGLPPHPTLLLDANNVQIIAQGPSGKLGYSKTYEVLRTVKDILLGLRPQLAPGNSGNWIVAINVLSDIMYLGQNAAMNEMHQFSVNINMILEPAHTRWTNRDPIPGDNPQATLTV